MSVSLYVCDSIRMESKRTIFILLFTENIVTCVFDFIPWHLRHQWRYKTYNMHESTDYVSFHINKQYTPRLLYRNLSALFLTPNDL